MCNYSEFIEERGIDKGIRIGQVKDLCNLMKNFKLTLEQAFQGLSIPEDEWDEYRQLVKDLRHRLRIRFATTVYSRVR